MTATPNTSTVYGSICVRNHGTLGGWAGTLRAGILYVDASSKIDASGLPGSHKGQADCNEPGNGEPDGSPGRSITLAVRQAIILGGIDASGGNGATSFPVNYAGPCTGANGNGAAGGAVTVQAQVLTLDAPISATGGAGGNDYVQPGTYKASDNIDVPKNGGAGGTIRVLLPHPIAALTPFLRLGGGAAGVVCAAADPGASCGARTYVTGTAGPAGHVVLGALTPAQAAMLPSLPAPLTSYLGAPPAALPPLPAPAFARGMACGDGDLDVGAGATRRLSGDHRYAHVCVHDSGTLLADPSLRLRARTILVDARSRLTATGAVKKTAGHGAAAGCTRDHTAPRPGAAAPPTTFPDAGNTPAPLAGGNGGGTVILVASRILLAGRVSADGGDGRHGQNGACSPSGCAFYYSGSNGGDGGDLLIVARDAQVTGLLSATGGKAGPPGTADDGSSAAPANPGGSGCIKIFVAMLRAPAGGLRVATSTLVGRPSSTDPLPPSSPREAHAAIPRDALLPH